MKNLQANNLLLSNSCRVALSAYQRDLNLFAERAQSKIPKFPLEPLVDAQIDVNTIISTASKIANGEMQEKQHKVNGLMLPLLEKIQLHKIKNNQKQQWSYPLEALNPNSIFPTKDKNPPNYQKLYNDFFNELNKIPESHQHNPSLWLDHFDTAWLTFAHSVPSNHSGVSLYDHSKVTAALAVALWQWHGDNLNINSNLKDWNSEKFLIIQGDFFGIQDFIFSEGQDTNKNAAKLLRGRSFQVSLFTEIAALKVLDALHLPPTSQIINAAGKFLIVAPNTIAACAALESVKTEINQWFLQHSFGLAGLGLIGKPASCNQLSKNKFQDYMKDLFGSLEKIKLRRFDLTAETHPVLDISYSNNVCCYNNKLPADKKYSEGSAPLSRDQITLGTGLTKKDRLLVIRDTVKLDGNNLRLQLEIPIFGFRIAFTDSEDVSGKFGEWAKDGNLLRCWDFSLPENLTDTLWHGYARRYINAYVPRNETDETDFLTFEDIAKKDEGQVALMALKGDVDNLGSIFQQGLQEPTLGKMAALSRQMNNFFAVWLPAVCKEDYPNTYTVFAGGDDFFLIGSWYTTQKLVVRMAEAFKIYVAENPDITFSAGMVMAKAKHPIHTLATQAEESLEKAKGTDQKEPKNAVVVFGERVRWTDWDNVQSVQTELERMQKSYDLSMGYVYGLFQLIHLAYDENNKNNPERFMWRSRFAYRTRRYVVDKLSKESQSNAQTDLTVALGEQGINQLGTRFRIPLFNYFYRQRNSNKEQH